ncbi:MAG: FAD-binding oxidoreductase, partial [Mogibacterium sp.]|nr:FAD-binding oxidoreductase [Mogibacterium sp.]
MAISQEIIAKLEAIVGKEDCLTADYELAAYSQGMIYTDPTRPDVLLLPETTEEVSEILKIANA